MATCGVAGGEPVTIDGPAEHPARATAATRTWETRIRFMPRVDPRLRPAAWPKVAPQRPALAIRTRSLWGTGDEPRRGCPADTGEATLVVLSFPGRDDVDLWSAGGCGVVSNGVILADGDLPTP